jgi:hypothetical protein
MRYRIGEAPIEGAINTGSADFVTLTVWLTLFIGIGFLIVGVRASQRWLAIWGGITIVACASYAVAMWQGLFA